jgi:ankyrin repeat protein
LNKGQSQFLTSPLPAQPLKFSLALSENHQVDDSGIPPFSQNQNHDYDDSDSRLTKMLASQARLRDGSGSDPGEDAVLNSTELSDLDKRRALQDLLAMSASNGEVDRVHRLLSGPAKDFVDINTPDADGNVPLIYASCFGHDDTVELLVQNGADVDKKDNASWSSLMWAITNRHKEIVKFLLDHGANPDGKTMSGRTAFDFVTPNSDMYDYLHDSGYQIGNVGVTQDFYDAGFSQGRFEEEMAENEMTRRMMMESARNLEVDLGNLTLDDHDPEVGYKLKT